MSAIFTYGLLLSYLLKSYELCPSEYYVTDENHSYCSQPFPNVIDQPVSLNERTAILEMHNHERRLVRGTNIEKMYWNDDLAEIALRYARGCIFAHDKASQRNVPRIPLSTGQNLAMGYENWTQAIDGWIEEKEYYFHGYPATGIVGHYTQMIWHSVVLVGCAATMCPPSELYNMKWPFYVCNYVTGQLNSNLYRPYDQGIEDQPLNDCQVNCSVLPPCPYQSVASCIAVNVPLECPRLCGLCERYEVLKQVYGLENLAPNTPAFQLMATSTISSSTKKKLTGRKSKNKLQKRPRKISPINSTWSIVPISND
ncbi:hypothetical protein I4U23_020597 [Adineta vaga]|nr:hypothetical protein I4U23_020597 [Adineta vaga]